MRGIEHLSYEERLSESKQFQPGEEKVPRRPYSGLLIFNRELTINKGNFFNQGWGVKGQGV